MVKISNWPENHKVTDICNEQKVISIIVFSLSLVTKKLCKENQLEFENSKVVARRIKKTFFS
jgi:hypothetical protein